MSSEFRFAPGFRAAGVACGLKQSGRRDLALLVADGPCAAAGVFTTSLVKAAPVLFDQALLAENAGAVRAVVGLGVPERQALTQPSSESSGSTWWSM